MRILSDGQPRTAKEIALLIRPNGRPYEIQTMVPQIRNAMLICQKWGEVEKVGIDEDGNHATIWQKVRT